MITTYTTVALTVVELFGVHPLVLPPHRVKRIQQLRHPRALAHSRPVVILRAQQPMRSARALLNGVG